MSRKLLMLGLSFCTLALSASLANFASAQGITDLGYQVIAVWDMESSATSEQDSKDRFELPPSPTPTSFAPVKTEPAQQSVLTPATVLEANSVDTKAIQNGAVVLGAKTSGVYQGKTRAGNGISVRGTAEPGWVATVSLADLTGDWLQGGPHDIVLQSSDSELKIRESDGSSYAIIDAGNLAEDTTYTLAGGKGTLLTSDNYSTYVTDIATALQSANNLSDLASVVTARTNLGLGSVATESTADFLQAASNLSDLGSAATARTNLGLGTLATQNANTVAITGGTVDGVTIGGTTTDAGSFSTLSSSGATTLASSTGNTAIGNAAGTLELISSGLDVSTTGVLSGITGFTQDSGDFSMSGSGTFTTGTGAIALNGNTTVASGKTLSVSSADSLAVGGLIVPQTVLVSFDLTATLIDKTVFIADNDYAVASARCVYSVAALSGGTLQVSVETGTTAPGAGTDQLISTIDLSSSVNTVQTGTVIASPTTISAGDRLSVDVGGTLTNLIGHCTIGLNRN